MTLLDQTKQHNIDPSSAPRYRMMHLGVDYGTSWSKIVFRDYEARVNPRSVVVRTTAEDGETGDYRFPSMVTLHEGRLWFGWQAQLLSAIESAHQFPSMKVLMAFPDAYHQERRPLPSSLNAQDLAILTVLYLLQRGRRAATQYAALLGAKPRVSMTLGVPMSQLDNRHLRDIFVDVGRTSFELLKNGAPNLSEGVKIEEAEELLRVAKSLVAQKSRPKADNWVRSEAAAALLWTFRSPTVPAGLYASVDVGAGTTSASWFRITDSGRTKDGIAFFGASCHPPGADAVESVIARAAGVRDVASVRTHANDFLKRLGSTSVAGLVSVCDDIFKVYHEAFSRAYPKDKLQSHWYGTSLFLLGGGTLIKPVRERLKNRVWTHLERDPPLIDPGRPDDLFELGGTPFRGDPGLLLVAYGLSHYQADVPETTSPSDIQDFTPVLKMRPVIDHEDLYTN